jgi:lysophospholipase L1-like esterase
MTRTLTILLLLVCTKAMAQKIVIEDELRFLALGDSYTIGESVTADQRWPVLLVDSLHHHGINAQEPAIIATTGWRTDELKKAIDKAKFKGTFSLVSLLIGVNNFYQGKSVESYAPEFEELLKTAIKLADSKKDHVFVLSIPDYGYTPFGQDKRAQITPGVDAFNRVNREITEKLGVRYFDITEISRKGLAEPDLVASDGLHPSGKMYAEWVELILKDATLVPEEEEEK